MIRILFQAIRHAPRLVWQAVFQPSKDYAFLKESKENVYISVLAFSFFGLLFGAIFAIPHYYLYNNIRQSIFFAVAVTGIFGLTSFFAVAVTGIFGLTSINAAGSRRVSLALLFFAFPILGCVGVFNFEFRLPFLLASYGITASLMASVMIAVEADFGPDFGGPLFSLLMVSTGPTVFLFLGWFMGEFMLMTSNMFINIFIRVILNVIKLPIINTEFFGKDLPIQIILTISKPYEMIIFPISFLINYFFSARTIFIFKGMSHQLFAKTQKRSLIWCPLTSFFIMFVALRDYSTIPGFLNNLIIVAIGFAVMPIFILHVSDYLLCIPIWLFQKRKATKYIKNPPVFTEIYENSILFKNEMLYFQLPGLHEFMSLFAKSMGIEEAVKRINHLDRFTFQQEQAQKALMVLAKDKDTLHQYLHLLLQLKNDSLIKSLSNTVRLGSIYLIQYRTRTKKGLMAKIDFICREMAKEQDYRFNSEMVKSLEAAHQFLASGKLKDFDEAYNTLESIGIFPVEIPYLRDMELVFSQLKKIKEELLKIASVQRFVTRRDVLNRQKQNFEALSKMTEESFYEPFAEIWKEALKHFAGVIEKEIGIQQGTAKLDIELKNREIGTSGEEQKLYFEIKNKGQEIASDIVADIQTDSPEIFFCGDPTAKFDIIEADTSKEFSISIIASTQLVTHMRGFIRFSDRIGGDKTHPFSFPLIVSEKEKVFREIKNPYIAGNPLSGDTSLYFGRQDALDYINKHILVGEEHHTIVCYGLRRTGKTSLLNRIIAEGFTDKRMIPIYMDIQGIDNESDFYLTLWDKITEALNSAESECKDFGGFKRFLKKAGNALGEKIIVILADEFEELQMRVESGKMPKDIFSNIRHLMQHEKKMIFLFCGTHQLEEMSKDYWSIFFNTAIYLKINFLEREDMEKLVREPVAGELDYDSLAVEQIFKMTHGQPYLTQLICRSLVNDMNERKKRNYASINDVDDAVEKIIVQGDDHFSTHIWDDSPTVQRLILSASAGELTDKQRDSISFDGIYDKISLVKKYDRREIMDTLGKLTSKDILTENKNNTGYSFPVNLFRLWVARKYPLRKVREEI